MSAGADSAEVETRVRSILERVAAACQRCGRDREGVFVVGASKRQPVERLATAFRCGIGIFGENQVQEAEAKRSQLPATAEWHLIGPLQSNKAKRAVALFSVIQSVDRLKIARVLDRSAAEAGRRLPVFLEVNLGGEASKHGFAPTELPVAAMSIDELEHLELVGLMAIPPPTESAEESRPWFRRLRGLRDQIRSADNALQPRWLSMGMSRDFEIAIEEGATHIRIGEALFGPRS